MSKHASTLGVIVGLWNQKVCSVELVKGTERIRMDIIAVMGRGRIWFPL